MLCSALSDFSDVTGPEDKPPFQTGTTEKMRLSRCGLVSIFLSLQWAVDSTPGSLHLFFLLLGILFPKICTWPPLFHHSIGQIMIPSDAHILILKTHEYVTLYGMRDFADMIKDLEMEDYYPGLSG